VNTIYYYYLIVTVFSFILYLWITNPDSIHLAYLRIRLLYINLRRFGILIRLYPRIKWDQYILKRNQKQK